MAQEECDVIVRGSIALPIVLTDLVTDYVYPTLAFETLAAGSCSLIVVRDNDGKSYTVEGGCFGWSSFCLGTIQFYARQVHTNPFNKKTTRISLQFRSNALQGGHLNQAFVDKSHHIRRPIEPGSGVIHPSSVMEFSAGGCSYTLLLDLDRAIELPVSCQCVRVIPWREFSRHAAICPERQVRHSCWCALNGDWTVLRARQEHVCPAQPMMCHLCGAQVPRSNRDSHVLNVCKQRTIERECHCGVVTRTAEQWDSHLCWKHQIQLLQDRLSLIERLLQLARPHS